MGVDEEYPELKVILGEEWSEFRKYSITVDK
jgi:hypothetical protein